MIENLCVSLGMPLADGTRPNVMVVLADNWHSRHDILTFASREVPGRWHFGSYIDDEMPEKWGDFNPKYEDGRQDEKIMWFLVKDLPPATEPLLFNNRAGYFGENDIDEEVERWR